MLIAADFVFSSSEGRSLKTLSPYTTDKKSFLSYDSLVILTGISEGGFLGGKLVARTPIRIERVVSGGVNKTLIIFGSNFLQTNGTVLIDDKARPGISSWSDSMIMISVGDDILTNWRIIEVITSESSQARYERRTIC